MAFCEVPPPRGRGTCTCHVFTKFEEQQSCIPQEPWCLPVPTATNQEPWCLPNEHSVFDSVFVRVARVARASRLSRPENKRSGFNLQVRPEPTLSLSFVVLMDVLFSFVLSSSMSTGGIEPDDISLDTANLEDNDPVVEDEIRRFLQACATPRVEALLCCVRFFLHVCSSFVILFRPQSVFPVGCMALHVVEPDAECRGIVVTLKSAPRSEHRAI